MGGIGNVRTETPKNNPSIPFGTTILSHITDLSANATTLPPLRQWIFGLLRTPLPAIPFLCQHSSLLSLSLFPLQLDLIRYCCHFEHLNNGFTLEALNSQLRCSFYSPSCLLLQVESTANFSLPSIVKIERWTLDFHIFDKESYPFSFIFNFPQIFISQRSRGASSWRFHCWESPCTTLWTPGSLQCWR